VRVSRDGLFDFVDGVLSGGGLGLGPGKCRGVALAEGDPASVVMILSRDGGEEKAAIEERIAEIAKPLGFGAKFIWLDGEAPERCDVSKSPWTWACVAGCIALGVTAGVSGLFWTLFWGTAAWFVSRTLISLTARKKIKKFGLSRL
jgi:hypothetical protein